MQITVLDLRLSICISLLVLAWPGSLCGQKDVSWQHQAQEMVQSQVVSRGIKDTLLLRTMTHTPRHLFVPEKYQAMAYRDHPLPIGYEQTISQPYIVALMTEWLALEGNEKVLEIGTGSGYQAAILSQLVPQVYSIEIVEPLALSSAKLLKQLGYDNVEVRYGDGYEGWPEHAPFDRIILTAAPEEIPQKLVDQLALGGRMILPVGKHYQQLVMITKSRTGISKEIITDVRFVPMIHGNK